MSDFKKQVKANEFIEQGPLGSLLSIIESLPTVSNMIAHKIGEEIVRRAKDNIANGGSEWGDFEPLWVDKETGPIPGHWTPEFNNEHRRSSRSSDQPLWDTGDLWDSIKVLGQTRTKKSGSMVVVGVEGDDDVVGRAWKHEYGGANPLMKRTENGAQQMESIPERPFLRPAIEAVEEDDAFAAYLEGLIQAEIEKASKKKKKGKRK